MRILISPPPSASMRISTASYNDQSIGWASGETMTGVLPSPFTIRSPLRYAPAQETPGDIVLRQKVLPHDGNRHLGERTGGSRDRGFELIVQAVNAGRRGGLPFAHGNQQD